MLIPVLISDTVGYVRKKGFANIIVLKSQFVHPLHCNCTFSMIQIKKKSFTKIEEVVNCFLMQVKVSTIEFE